MKPFNPSNFLVLVVDDLSLNLQIVGTILEQEGYGTTFATSGKQALERISRANPDLILLDLMMPEMDGLQLCKHIQINWNSEDIPIIFLTASHEKKHLLEAFNRGAVDYITKPFNAPELLARVKTHLELKHTRDELKKALAELEKLATTDSLTCVANRGHLLAMGEQEFSRARRYQRPLSVLMLDIDRFKQINDNYGHAMGDEALKAIARAIADSLRKGDCLGRFGGEEFVVFLPETDLAAAMKIGDRIRLTIAEISFFSDENSWQITASIGVAAYTFQDETIDDLIKRADKALYCAKHQGRDRVVAISADVDFPTPDVENRPKK